MGRAGHTGPGAAFAVCPSVRRFPMQSADPTLVRPRPQPRRFDAPTLEMIVVVMLLTLHDFLLSDVLSLPGAVKPGLLQQLRSLDHVASSLELVVPVAVFALMFILWLLARNAWVRGVAMLYLGWVTLRLTAKTALILTIIVSRPQSGVGVLLRD